LSRTSKSTSTSTASLNRLVHILIDIVSIFYVNWWNLKKRYTQLSAVLHDTNFANCRWKMSVMINSCFFQGNPGNRRCRSERDLSEVVVCYKIPHDHLLLDRVPSIGPVISRWELGKFKNCWNKNFRTYKILTLLYQQLSNLLISQQDMSGQRYGALSNNRWSGVFKTKFNAASHEFS
jgi:hypothetical protein